MKISKRGEYALRALIDIGIASQQGKAVVRTGELAEHEKLPAKFLEQILMQLKGGGFVGSKRGQQGGYHLRKPMEQISFGAVIRLVDGPLAPISCVSVTAYERCSCPDEAHCGLRMVMLEARNALSGILDRYSLADVVAMSLEAMRRDRVVHPFLAQEAGMSRAHEGNPDAKKRTLALGKSDKAKAAREKIKEGRSTKRKRSL